MINEKMLEILILHTILTDYSRDEEYQEFINQNYNINSIQQRYLELGKEYLQQYALNKTEKSD